MASRAIACALIAFLLAATQTAQFAIKAQSPAPSNDPTTTASSPLDSHFRFERIPVEGGAELLTVFGSLGGLTEGDSSELDVPLVSLVRDNLGDNDIENDRLRYVWMLTYARPSFFQRSAAIVPFFYSRVGSNQNRSLKNAPPPLIDLASTEKDVWDKILWFALQNIFLDPYGFPIKASTRTYRRNASDYRKSHVIRALAILALYQQTTGSQSVFTFTEMREIQARLTLTQETFGGILDDKYLQKVFEKEPARANYATGQNWEMLRQRAEAEGLYFEPLEMPDGNPTHAILWVAEDDLAKNRDRKFNSRFLNIRNPWKDKRLRNWQGYSEIRHLNGAKDPVDGEGAEASGVRMIPLALYGLDHPKIPALLVDFRNSTNPKQREISRRALDDTTRLVLSVSRFGDLSYFVGRTVYDFVTGRRGMDVNQPSRLRTYSQLKFLLSLNASLDPKLRDEIQARLKNVSTNPLENGMQAEANLAKNQYAALLSSARNGGLSAKLDRDRREEMVALKHGRTERVLFRVANVASFGIYTHREKATPEMAAKLDLNRRLAYHTSFLREVAASSPQIEVVWEMDPVWESLRFIAENGKSAGRRTAQAVAEVFRRTQDPYARALALNGLSTIDHEKAKAELLRIYEDDSIEQESRQLIAEYLKKAVEERQRIYTADARTIATLLGIKPTNGRN